MSPATSITHSLPISSAADLVDADLLGRDVELPGESGLAMDLDGPELRRDGDLDRNTRRLRPAGGRRPYRGDRDPLTIRDKDFTTEVTEDTELRGSDGNAELVEAEDERRRQN